MTLDLDDETLGQIVAWLQRTRQEMHVGRGGIWLRPARVKRPRLPPWPGFAAWDVLDKKLMERK